MGEFLINANTSVSVSKLNSAKVEVAGGSSGFVGGTEIGGGGKGGLDICHFV